jgi:Fe-S-cluster containining protein
LSRKRLKPRLSRAEEWVITTKLGNRSADIDQLPMKNLLLELYPLAFRGLAKEVSHEFLKRQRKFIERCYLIRDSCSRLQRKLLIYLATTGDTRFPPQIDLAGSIPECFTCENPCCIITMNSGVDLFIKCHFFANHRCLVYEIRPELCRTFVCPEIAKLPPGYSFVRLRSEFYGDNFVGNLCKNDCYIFTIPAANVETAMTITLNYGIDHPTRDGIAWKRLRQLGALEIKRDYSGIWYEPI